VRAPILARAGELSDAQALAQSALDLAMASEAPLLQAEAMCELAGVLWMAGRIEDARQLADGAAAQYAAKGDVVSAARVRTWLTALKE
jgi:hypothetical protein